MKAVEAAWRTYGLAKLHVQAHSSSRKRRNAWMTTTIAPTAATGEGSGGKASYRAASLHASLGEVGSQLTWATLVMLCGGVGEKVQMFI